MLHIQKHLHIHQRSSLNIFTKSIFHNSQKLSITESGYHQKNKLYWFPVATVTNYYILSGLKQLRFIILHFQKSEIRNGSHWAKRNILAGLCFFLKTSRNNLFCFVFLSNFRRLPHMLVHCPLPIPQSQQWLHPSHILSLWQWLFCPTLPSLRALVMTLG